MATLLLHLQPPAPRPGGPHGLLACAGSAMHLRGRRAPPRAATPQRPSHDLPLRDQAGGGGGSRARRETRGATSTPTASWCPEAATPCADGRPAGRHLSRPGVRAAHAALVTDRERRAALAADLARLWMTGCGDRQPGERPQRRERPPASRRAGPPLDYPSAPAPGRRVRGQRAPSATTRCCGSIDRLGAHVSGLESCTSPDRWQPLRSGLRPTGAPARPRRGVANDAADDTYESLAAAVLEAGMCPRRSTVDRRAYLAAGSTRPSPRPSSTLARASATPAPTTPCWSPGWPTSAGCPSWRSRSTSPSTPTARCARGSRPSWRRNSSTTTCSTTDDLFEES